MNENGEMKGSAQADISEIKGLLIGHSTAGKGLCLEPSMANRHGFIAGATGTGKSVTLKRMAEEFSKIGVPVFLSDVKGDLAGLGQAGAPLSQKLEARLKSFNALDSFAPAACKVRLWDVYAEKGIPVRTTISEMGPLLLSRLLELNETQQGVLSVIFRIADDEGLLLMDLKDLRSMATYVNDNARQFSGRYGNISTQTVGAIQRKLLNLEDQGGDLFLAEPALDIADWMQTEDGRGIINILDCTKLINSPLLYSTFLLWMMTKLYETMPEVGDLDKPKVVFFFDEAHLLFDKTPASLISKIEQVVRLIRSKGVGIYFVTQSPKDIPDSVLAQLGNRIQHALRAYTPKEQVAIKAAAESFRENPDFDTKQAITELGIGEALVSLLDEEGRPQVVERGFIMPPNSSMSAPDAAVIEELLSKDELLAKYEDIFDRDSAYEMLERRSMEDEEAEKAESAAGDKSGRLKKSAEESSKSSGKSQKGPGRPKKNPAEKVFDSALNTFGRSIGRSIYRGIMGMMK